MKKITINLTDEQERFLKKFAAEQHEGAENNLATRKPLHLVQSKKVETLFDDGDYAREMGDEVKYFDTHHQDVLDSDIDVLRFEGVCEEDIVSFEDAEHDVINDVLIENIDDYFTAYGIDPERYVPISQRDKWETAAYFFILSEAREYIKYQAHNLGTARTMTVSMGYSNNGEYEPFYDLLMGIGEQLNKGDI